jgi:exonuclease SbcD
MKLLHTADWHLCDRLGRIDRTDDLRRAVERIAGYCAQEQVEVLLVAGDLFSELARPDGLRDAVRHLQTVFGPFLHGGGTILTLTGNHDNENFCQTLRHAMSLAAPVDETPGTVLRPGRLYLAAEPTLVRLQARAGHEVQFVLMPYPTPARYLRGEQQRYASLEEKNQVLTQAFTHALHALRQHVNYATQVPTVVAAHLAVMGAHLGGLFRLSEEQDVVFDVAQLPADVAYVALGHIHRAQAINGQAHVRYSGSIERMDLGEQDDHKSVVLVEIGPTGLVGTPQLRPLPSTAVYEVTILQPTEDVPHLRTTHADAQTDLVNLHITYTAGESLEDILRNLGEIFPRWYSRDWRERGELGPALQVGAAQRGLSFEETVRNYVAGELANHAEAEKAALLERLERWLNS